MIRNHSAPKDAEIDFRWVLPVVQRTVKQWNGAGRASRFRLQGSRTVVGCFSGRSGEKRSGLLLSNQDKAKARQSDVAERRLTTWRVFLVREYCWGWSDWSAHDMIARCVLRHHGGGCDNRSAHDLHDKSPSPYTDFRCGDGGAKPRRRWAESSQGSLTRWMFCISWRGAQFVCSAGKITKYHWKNRTKPAD